MLSLIYKYTSIYAKNVVDRIAKPQNETLHCLLLYPYKISATELIWAQEKREHGNTEQNLEVN
jgi:hypothetical protein